MASQQGDISDEDSDGDSSLNEYAEGLGCADRKRCRERPCSGFEFDNHPREEYFEQPQPCRDAPFSSRSCALQTAADDDDDDDELEPPEKRRRGMSALAELEAREAEAAAVSRAEAVRNLGVLNQRMAAVARRCERRKAVRETQLVREEEGIKPPIANKLSEADSPLALVGTSVLPDVRLNLPAGGVVPLEMLGRCCQNMVAIRTRAAKSQDPASGSLEVLNVLAALRTVAIDASLLQASGIGLELNRREWRRHATPVVSKKCTALVAKWRATIGAERQRHGEAGGA